MHTVSVICGVEEMVHRRNGPLATDQYWQNLLFFGGENVLLFFKFKKEKEKINVRPNVAIFPLENNFLFRYLNFI